MTKSEIRMEEERSLRFLKDIRDGKGVTQYEYQLRVHAAEAILHHCRETLSMEIEQEEWEG